MVVTISRQGSGHPGQPTVMKLQDGAYIRLLSTVKSWDHHMQSSMPASPESQWGRLQVAGVDLPHQCFIYSPSAFTLC